jgi:hypothetical protein
MDDTLTDAEIRKVVVTSPTPEEWSRFPVHVYWVNVHLCRAQSAKTKAALVAERWKSPEEVSQFLDDHVRITNRAVDQARADERKAASQLVGRYLRQKVHYEEAVIAETRIMWLEEAILKGERP